MKKIFRITESELKNLVKESVKRVIKEGTTDQQLYSTWDNIAAAIGPENMLMAIYNYMPSDEIAEMVRLLKRDYDVNDIEDAAYEELDTEEPEWADYEEIK